jgi:cobalamin biosynthesis protein CbiD
MTERHHESQKTHLTVALAQGTSAAKWARTNGVPKATAYRWSKEPAVRAQIKSIRRRAIDRAVGRMARRMTWATDGIAKLAKNAKSESVQLSALRSILSDMRAFSEFLGREQRSSDTDIEERHYEHSAPATSMG